MQRFRLLALCLLAWLHGVAAAQAPSGQATRGVLELPTLAVDAVVPLDGEWAFAWERFVDPGWIELPTQAFAPALGGWNATTADGKPLGRDGWGSYALLVRCPPGERYAVSLPNERTAVHFFVNGKPVGAHGDPGPSPEQSRPAVQVRNPISAEFDCPLRLTVHLSNYNHRTGGMFKAVQLGKANALAAQSEQRIVFDAALLGAYVLTAALMILFFWAYRDDRAPLLFGLFCLAIAVYADITGERLLLRLLPAELPWEFFLRIEWISWFLSLGLFSATLHALFPEHVAARPVRVLVGICAAGVLAVMVTPGRVYSYLAPVGQVLTGVIVLHGCVAMVVAARRGSRSAQLLVVGMAAILVALVADVVLYYFYAPRRRFVPVGAAVFVFLPAIVLVRRLARALGAEARTRTLEENVRLREEVDRIGRHDLKTPLASIVAVPRLLREEHRVGPEADELLGIVERAGWRILSMVNLSLDLYKMEQGSYAFRPDAVELPALAATVLEDVQVHAASKGVRFDVQLDGLPFAWAEELLCYSLLANLVKNAVEASPENATVTLRGEAAADGSVTLHLHNEGAVPIALRGRFFEKYATAGKSGGSGLGAYSARLMARVQDGDIVMRSSEADGTTLSVRLRAAPAGAMPAVRRHASAPEPVKVLDPATLPPWRVLLVDDDEYNLLIVRRLLPVPPFEVETAVNGRVALDAVGRRWPDLVFMDLDMPVMGGLDAVRELRRLQRERGLPAVPMVALSSHDDDGTSAEALAAGFDRYLTKPVTREKLHALLLALAPGGRVSESTVQPETVTVDADLAPLMDDFLASRRAIVETLPGALAAGDREAVRRAAHKLAGSLAMYGLHGASRHCRWLEDNHQRVDAAALDALVIQLRAQLDPAGIRLVEAG